jgi:hypothetical protein
MVLSSSSQQQQLSSISVTSFKILGFKVLYTEKYWYFIQNKRLPQPRNRLNIFGAAGNWEVFPLYAE